MASQFASMTNEEMIQIIFLWCIISFVLGYTKTTINLSVDG